MEFGLYGARCSHIALLPHLTVDGTVNKPDYLCRLRSCGRPGLLWSIRPVHYLSDEVLAWLSVWSGVHVVCLWSS